MTRNISDKAFAAIIALPDEQRYAYFIKHVADDEAIWSLWGKEGWVLVGDVSQRELVPVWPHPKFANACVGGVWAGTTPRAIDLSFWLTRWIPGMIRDNREIAVFPTPSLKGVIVSPSKLQKDLEAEMLLYE